MTPTTPMWRSDRTAAPRLARFLVLHSPLVGPRTVSPLAEALQRLGHRAAVPDLSSAISASGLSAPTLRTIVGQSVSSMPQHSPLIVVAHSGASAYLPVLAPELQAAGQVLIDAVLPPRTGSFRPSADFRSELDRLVEADQHLPPWPLWWSEDVFARLVPDPDLRAAIGRECPRLPISFYDTVIEVPTDWAQTWTGYLRLSVGYEPEAAATRRLGWQVRRRSGGHLDTATRPDEVALDLIAVLQPVLTAET